MKFVRKVLAVLICFSLVSTIALQVEAENANNMSVKEKRGQINFSDFNIGIKNKKELCFSAKKRTRENIKQENDLIILVSKHENLEKNIIDSVLNNNNMECLGYVTVELEKNKNGEYVPIMEEDYKGIDIINSCEAASIQPGTKPSTPKSKKESRGNYFTLTTTIYRNGKKANGDYKYCTTSEAYWTNKRWLGGEDSPGSSEDYLYQTLPKNCVITKDSLSTNWYDCSITHDGTAQFAEKQKNWQWREKIKDNYVGWKIKDVPEWNIFGSYVALRQAKLSVNSVGPQYNGTRQIRSYYVHTWEEVSIDVSATVGKKSTTLTITPKKKNKSWTLASYVTFDY